MDRSICAFTSATLSLPNPHTQLKARGKGQHLLNLSPGVGKGRARLIPAVREGPLLSFLAGIRGQSRASQPLLLQMLKTLCFEYQTQHVYQTQRAPFHKRKAIGLTQSVSPDTNVQRCF